MIKYSFEEVKMMYESAEKVSERRISANKFNYSICAGLFVAIAVIWKWGTADDRKYYLGAILFILILTAVAIVFCIYWKKQIQGFKDLNEAKFKVIEEMSEKLYFDSPEGDFHIISYTPFSKEWESLQKSKKLTKNKDNSWVFKYTENELFMPFAFGGIFAFLGLIALITIIANPCKTIDCIKYIIQL